MRIYGLLLALMLYVPVATAQQQPIGPPVMPVQGDSARCAAGAVGTVNSTVACPGNTVPAAATQLNLSLTMPDGTPYTACFHINNIDPRELTYFVPLSTYQEWAAFMAAAPANGLQLIPCGAAPACGSAHGADYSTAPSTNLCAAGSTASAVTWQAADAQYVWTCSQGGSNVNCASLAQCSPPGSLYLWNGINWDDYLMPNWTPGWVGAGMTMPPAPIGSTMKLWRGIYHIAPGTTLSCGPAAGPCDNDTADGLSSGHKYCSGVSREEFGCIVIYSGLQNGSSAYLDPIHGLHPSECASGQLTPDSGYQNGEYHLCPTPGLGLFACTFGCHEIFRSTCL